MRDGSAIILSFRYLIYVVFSIYVDMSMNVTYYTYANQEEIVARVDD